MTANSNFSARLGSNSHTGPYSASFDISAFDKLNAYIPENAHFLIDRQVAALYAEPICDVLDSRSVMLIDAIEANKSLDRMPNYVEHLVAKGVRRNHILIAIGGGIIQDITCFLAATLLRGVEWKFYPTTLLAQADSCIGSKSSINAGTAKNILGTFTPPREVVISTRVLKTLKKNDLRSGIGEMLKVHAIEGSEAFSRIANDYDALFEGNDAMLSYIRRSLEIKKAYIETDEFDRGARNVFNYGHSFGHAIESATNFAIPHGIGVTIGMDMANFISSEIGFGNEILFNARHGILKRNFLGFEDYPVPLNAFLDAISKDKKNVGEGLTLILPNKNAQIRKKSITNDKRFQDLCAAYLQGVRAS